MLPTDSVLKKKSVCVLGRSFQMHISVHNLNKPTNATKNTIFALSHLQRKMMVIWSETVINMTLWHVKILLSTCRMSGILLKFFCTRIKVTVYCAKYQNLNVPSIHFLTITLQKWLLSSFGAKWLSFMKKEVLCFIPHKYCAQHWDFLTISLPIYLARDTDWWYHPHLKCSTYK